MTSSRAFEVPDYIKAVGELPDLILQHYSRTPVTLNDQLIVEAFRRKYKVRAEWLIYLREPVGNPQPDLATTWEKHHKVGAELSFAELKIAEAIWEREQVQKPTGVDSGSDWWYKCELEGCENALKCWGLIGPPAITGKREWANFGIAFLAYKEKNFSKLLFGSKEDTVTNTPRIVLSGYMTKLAIEDDSFRNKYYLPYLRKERQYVYTIRNVQEIKAVFLMPDDELLVLEKYKKVPEEYQSYRDNMPELPGTRQKGTPLREIIKEY